MQCNRGAIVHAADAKRRYSIAMHDNIDIALDVSTG